MDVLIKILPALLTPILVHGIIAILRRPRKAEFGKVYLPLFIAVIGSVVCAIFLIFTLISAFCGGPVFLSVALFVLSLLGAFLIVAYINCRTEYDEYGFTARNLFGRKRHFTYAQVSGIRFGESDTYLHMGKATVALETFGVGTYEFITLVHQKYSELHDGQNIPKAPWPKNNPFKGNLKDPWALVFVYIIVSALFIGVFAMVCMGTFVPATPENTVCRQICFGSVTEEDGTLLIRGTGDRLYKVYLDDRYIDREKILSLCDGETPVTVYCKEYEPKEKEAYSAVKALYTAEEEIVEFGDTYRIAVENALPVVIFFAVLGVFWFGFVVLSFLIGRYPEKFSKKFRNRFFRPSAWSEPDTENSENERIRL